MSKNVGGITEQRCGFYCRARQLDTIRRLRKLTKYRSFSELVMLCIETCLPTLERELPKSKKFEIKTKVIL